MAIPLHGTRSPQSTRSTPVGSGHREAAPQLALVPRRRRVAWFAVTVTVLISAVMMGAVYLHTQIAERQLEIDRLDRRVRVAQEEFDILRAERAELRSPTRLAERASVLGMAPGRESEFAVVDPMTVAVTVARTGELPFSDEIDLESNARLEPLDQFRLVKEVSAETP